MVPSIARQSVILKCNMQKSVMLGNYEFFYAAGLMRKLYNIEIRTDMEPEQILEAILQMQDNLLRRVNRKISDTDHKEL